MINMATTSKYWTIIKLDKYGSGYSIGKYKNKAKANKQAKEMKKGVSGNVFVSKVG